MRIRCLLLMFKVKADTSHYEQSLLNSLKLRVINYHYRSGLHCKRVPCLFNFKEVIFNTVYTFLIFFSDPNVNIGIKEKRKYDNMLKFFCYYYFFLLFIHCIDLSF